VSWRIFATAAADPDLAVLSDAQRASLNEDLFSWVETGPPRQHKRTLLELEVFEDVVPSGFRITYFVNGEEPYVAILRIRAI
jgi:mRNA-degrading endonuclease RelE of RelBE toxin-antitoxin system